MTTQLTEQEIIEGNKLIAEFMGFTLRDDGETWEKPAPDFNIHYVLCYHFKWDWLMPVVEKICKLEAKPPHTDSVHDYFFRTFGMVNDETGEYMVRINGFSLHRSLSLIIATYEAVIEFIRYFNKNLTPSPSK